MFGFVSANGSELSKEQRKRYGAVYCGICRRIRENTCNGARLTLQYDMAFLALLLMSLYEPEETAGPNACRLHPITKRPWVDNEYIGYSADMNVLLAYYKCKDDIADERSFAAGQMAKLLEAYIPALREKYPRQSHIIEETLTALTELEQAGCDNPDLPANLFGQLMAELFVYRQDQWENALRKLGMGLGRFIYLADAAADYRRDRRKKQYNPFLSMKTGENPDLWQQYLELAMGLCTDYYERLPLVQDKALLDNILYSGVWVQYRMRQPGGKR